MNSSFSYEWTEELREAALNSYLKCQAQSPASIRILAMMLFWGGVLSCALTRSAQGSLLRVAAGAALAKLFWVSRLSAFGERYCGLEALSGAVLWF